MTKTIFVFFVFILIHVFSINADLFEIYRLQNKIKSSYNDIEKLQTIYKNKLQDAVLKDQDFDIKDLKLKINEELSKCQEQNAAYEILNKIYAEQIAELQIKTSAKSAQLEETELRLNNSLTTINTYATIINDQDKELYILKDDVEAKSQIILNMQTKAQDIADKLKYLEVVESTTPPTPTELVASSCLAYENASGVHLIKVDEEEAFDVLCDYELDGPGWTVIQRRLNGSVKFYRNWVDYKKGFGSLLGEFFIGLEKLHRMTTAVPHELYIHLTDFQNESSHAFYDNFVIAGESDNYTLSELGEYSGNAGDSMRDNEHQKFSTYDRDNESNCAQRVLGAWWYTNCGSSNLNGQYSTGDEYYDSTEHGIYWDEWKGPGYTLQSVQIMIRPKMDTEIQTLINAFSK